MKAIKIIIIIFSLAVISQLTYAQTCKGNTVLMSKGSRGCGCQCQKKCVAPGDVQAYLADGWYYGDCVTYCCFLHGGGWWKTALTGISAAPHSQIISFSLSQKQHVSFKVFDMNGSIVTTAADQISKEGENNITWNVSGVKTGIYLLKMEVGDWSAIKKVSVIN